MSFGQKWIYYDKEHADEMINGLTFQEAKDFREAKYQFRETMRRWVERNRAGMVAAMDADGGDGSDDGSADGSTADDGESSE